MSKFTKKQQIFFERFARNTVINTLLLQLTAEGTEVPPETVAKIVAVIDAADVSLLTQTVGDRLLERVDFALLLKVEKFLTSSEAMRAMTAAQEVGALVQDEIFTVLREVFKDVPEETPAE